jgi:hypothetical protein
MLVGKRETANGKKGLAIVERYELSCAAKNYCRLPIADCRLPIAGWCLQPSPFTLQPSPFPLNRC